MDPGMLAGVYFQTSCVNAGDGIFQPASAYRLVTATLGGNDDR